METETVTETTGRKVGRNHVAIQLEFALRGLQGVQTLFQQGEVSRATLQRAAKELASDESINSTELVAWVGSLAPATSGNGPGRGSLQPGETRNYKVQEVAGARFLRLSTPSATRKDSIPVELSADGKTMIVHLDQAISPVIAPVVDES